MSKRQMELDLKAAYSLREWVRARLEGFPERQKARDQQRARRAKEARKKKASDKCQATLSLGVSHDETYPYS